MKKISLLAVVCVLFLMKSYSQTINTDLVYKVNDALKKTDKPSPVLIMLHGYGSNEEDLFDIAKGLDQRFVTFSLRGPIATKNAGFCWYSLDFLPDQQFKYDYKQAKESRSKILSFISNACKEYRLDSSNVFVMGFSQGSIMAYDLAISSPKKIKGVIALSGRLMDETKILKTDWLQVAKVNFFIAHGTSDKVIKVEEAEKANAFLKLKKVKEVSYFTYEIPHSINGKELNNIKAWLVKAIDPPKLKPEMKK